mmetsp:Transcript_24605/g.49919  ORF Transcript_24605/g.49919 Transcript_24605/m.49919 type:complete len:289 (+) Transcript_24605:445-1311(+)
MQPTTVGIAIDVLPSGVLLGSFQITPRSARIERDDRPYGAHKLVREPPGSASSGSAAGSAGALQAHPLHLRQLRQALGSVGTVLPDRPLRVKRQAPRSEGPFRLSRRGRCLDGLLFLVLHRNMLLCVLIVDVRDEDTIQIHDLLERAEPAVADILRERHGESPAGAVRDVDVTNIPALVDVQHQGSFGGVEQGEGVLPDPVRKLRRLEGRPSIGADHQAHVLPGGAGHLHNQDEVVGHLKFVALRNTRLHRLPEVVCVCKVDALHPTYQPLLTGCLIPEVSEVDPVTL